MGAAAHPAQEATTMLTDPAQVADGFAAAWNDADADSVAALFAADADFVNVVGLRWTTREQIRANHAYGFRHMFSDARMTLEDVTVRRLGDDAAVVHAAWRMSGQVDPAGERAGDRSGVLTFTVARRPDGGWLAVSAQNTDRVPGAQTHVATGARLDPKSYSPRAQRRAR
ncbi:SgcJ/EcaC family oxidoreductase [Kocuria sp. CPCC 205300]|uniref:SgcJ/EcaC family oxidoreductase n=1 Tax=Kocuria sabuli TaxID=3071448 RepID=UPI0036DC688E